MGVDIYMNWDGMTEQDKEKQYTGWRTTGANGYLRGAYFGGYSDVLRDLFNWMDWDKVSPFNADMFEWNLNELIACGGARFQKEMSGVEMLMQSVLKIFTEQGAELVHPSADRGAFIDKDEINEYVAFLNLGKRLIAEGKNPTVYISY